MMSRKLRELAGGNHAIFEHSTRDGLGIWNPGFESSIEKWVYKSD